VQIKGFKYTIFGTHHYPLKLNQLVVSGCLKRNLVVKGYKQKQNVDYFDTYSLVTRIASLRILFAIASIYKLVVHQMVVKIAFLNGDLEEEFI
jgi:hypothetical protein